MGEVIAPNFRGAGNPPAVRSAGSSGGRTYLSRRDIVPAFIQHQLNLNLEEYITPTDFGDFVLSACALHLREIGEKAVAALAPVLHLMEFMEDGELLSADEVFREVAGSPAARRSLAGTKDIDLSSSRQEILSRCLRFAKAASVDGLKYHFLDFQKADAATRRAARLAAIAIVLDPKDQDALITLGTTLADTDEDANLNVAAGCFRAVLEIDPGCANAYTGRAYVAYKRAWTQGKEEKFQLVIKIASEAEARSALGPVLRTMRFIAFLTSLTRAYLKERADSSGADIEPLTRRFLEQAHSAEKDIEPTVQAYRHKQAQYYIRTGLDEFLQSCLDWENYERHNSKARENIMKVLDIDLVEPDRLALLFFMGKRPGSSSIS
jgi:hypothetical protein